jgi:glycine/D-amino acid oxidase-like deaminating enzyme
MASAVHLARQGLGEQVVLVERDLSYGKNSAMLSAGGIRQQFSLRENIELSTYSFQFLQEMEAAAAAAQDVREDHGVACSSQTDDCSINFRANGYLFLAASEGGQQTLARNYQEQRACGVDWIDFTDDSAALQKTYPWLHTDDITAACYSRGGGEGYFDPWAYVNNMKREAQALGVTVVEGLVVDATVQHAAAGAAGTGSSGRYVVDSILVQHAGKGGAAGGAIAGQHLSLKTSHVVNCAGAYAGRLTDMIARRVPVAGGQGVGEGVVRLPVQPRKRFIFSIHCPGTASFALPAPTSAAPLTVDPYGGVYFRGEGNVLKEGKGGHFICGVSPQADQDPDCEDDSALDVVDHSLFDDTIWPTLAERVPAFNELKVTGAWAGFYDYNTLDQNLVLGFHPQLSNVLHANGLSGHGLQMGPAVGRAVAEHLEHGRSTTLDLSAFSFDRIEANKPYFEYGIV